MSPMSLFRHQNSRFVNNIMVATRNPGTKTDRENFENFGLDQDQENFEKVRPDGSCGQWIPHLKIWLF